MGGGISQPSRGGREMKPRDVCKAFSFPAGVDMRRMRYGSTSLTQYSILPDDDDDKKFARKWLIDGDTDGGVSPGLDRAVGSMLANAVGDALGAPLEFSPYVDPYEDSSSGGGMEEEEARDGDLDPMYLLMMRRRRASRGTDPITGFDDVSKWMGHGPYNRFGLEVGQWTDDASMGLCLADSLLIHYPAFDPYDLRLRFVNWWQYGYNNAFGYDNSGPRSSVGLGGNIGAGMSEFLEKKTPYTTAGNRETSGNGSIMRMAAVPVCYHDDMDTALDVAYKQSKTTHQGDESAECSRLMTYIIVRAINDGPTKRKEILETLGDHFTSPLYSVQCLAKSVQESPHESNKHLHIEDRNWQWRAPKYSWCRRRATQQPGYIGSYAMDGLCMALHCLWTTDSFSACVLKAVNMRGDADTVGAIAAQMAGAFYGVSGIPKEWYMAVMKWDRGGDIAAKAIKLYNHTKVTLPPAPEGEESSSEESEEEVYYRDSRFRRRMEFVQSSDDDGEQYFSSYDGGYEDGGYEDESLHAQPLDGGDDDDDDDDAAGQQAPEDSK